MRKYIPFVRGHRYIVAKVEHFGLVLIPVFFVCVLLTGTVGFLLTLFWLVAVRGSGLVEHSMARELISFLGFKSTLIISVACIWSYFLYLTFRAFARVTVGGRASIQSVIQLIAATDFTFAVLHYYVALLASGTAYSGITPTKPFYWPILGDPIDKFLRVPPLETVVDCVYFSSSTMATVGFGDIYPISVLAKMVTTLQIIVSFSLVVVVLGSVASRSTPAQQTDERSTTRSPD
jgi:hypothetical protein